VDGLANANEISVARLIEIEATGVQSVAVHQISNGLNLPQKSTFKILDGQWFKTVR